MSALPRTDGYRWFTWGSQAPTYDETTVIWMPALVRDGEFLPLGSVEHGEIVPRRGCAWASIGDTSPWQWGDEIKRRKR